MFYDADEALQLFLASLAYDVTTPRVPIFKPVDNGQLDYSDLLAAYESLPKLLPGGCAVGMPPEIPKYKGPKAYVDSFSTNNLGLHGARSYCEVEYPLLITVLTNEMSTPTNLLNKKTCGLILKALARNITLGLDDIRLRIPSDGTVRWGIMPSNRVNYSGKSSKNYAGQILVYVEESDDM